MGIFTPKKSLKRYTARVLNFLLLFSLIVPNVLSPAIVIAQELNIEQEESTIEIPIDESEDILEEGISTSIFEQGVYTISLVEEKEYVYPEDDRVRIRFTSITEEGDLTIKKVILTEEEKLSLNTTDEYAWDFTSTMSNGSFTYDLVLPNNQGEEIEVKYSENGSTYSPIEEVLVNEGIVKISGLDHFTTFVVVPLGTIPGDVTEGTTQVDSTCNVSSDSGMYCYDTIQEALTDATDGTEIQVLGGTHVLSTALNMNIPNVTLLGLNNPTLQVSGTGYRVIITASGNTVSGFTIEKTDKTGVQNIIFIQANDTTISNNTIFGRYEFGDGDVSRAMEITGGLSNLQITGNTFYDIRQPAYINGPTTGLISNNHTYKTRGWVLEEGDVTFLNNTWGTGLDANIYDIAILSTVESLYYTDIHNISIQNNDASIEDQRTSPATLSIVYVDENVTTSGDGTARSPKRTISEALVRVIDGGVINLSSNLDTSEEIRITKSVTVDGNSYTIYPNFSKTSNSNNSAIGILTNHITLKNLIIDGTSGVNLHGIKTYKVNNILLENISSINNDNAGIVVNGSIVQAKDIETNNNGWGGINVDQGIGVTLKSKFTIEKTSIHSEMVAIWIDDINKDVSVIDIDNQYSYVDYGDLRVYYLDKIAPTVELLSPVDNYFTNQTSVIQTWTSTDTDIDYYEYESCSNNPDNDGFCTRIYSTTTGNTSRTVNNNNITFWWRVRAIDIPGNMGNWSEARKITIDTTKPSTPEFFAPENNLYTNINFIKLEWTGGDDMGSGVKGYTLGYTFTPANGGTEKTWNTGLREAGNPYWHSGTYGHGEGKYVFWVKTVDKAGNEGPVSETLSVTYDKTAPLMPSGLYFWDVDNNKAVQCGGFSNTRHINEHWDATNDINLSHYEYSSFNAPSGSAGLIKSVFYTNYFNSSWWNIPTEGTYGFQVRTLDLAGNISPWAFNDIVGIDNGCKITIDWTAPMVQISNPLENGTLKGNVIIQGNVKDTNLSHYNISIYNGDADVNDFSKRLLQNTENTTEFDTKNLLIWDTTEFDDGEYQIRLAARDLAGNRDDDTSIQVIKVLVDNTPPTTEQPTQNEQEVLGANTTTNSPTLVKKVTTFVANILGVGGEGDALALEEEENLENDEEVKGSQTCDNPSTISGYIYTDSNENGEKDEKERVFPEISIRVYTITEGMEETVKQIVSDENGYWETTLCIGDYYISIDDSKLPNNYVLGENDQQISVEEEKDSTLNFEVLDERNFLQKYWPWILLALGVLGSIGIVVLDTRRKKEYV